MDRNRVNFIDMSTITEESDWESEIKRRVLEVENGEAELIDHEVVMREVREQLHSTPATEEIDRAWTKEALRRLAEIESGREKAIDADDAIAENGIDVIRRRVENVRCGRSKTIDGPTGLAQVRRAIRK